MSLKNACRFSCISKPLFDATNGFMESFYKGDTWDWNITVCPLDPLDSAPSKWVTSRLGVLKSDEVPLHNSRERYGVALPNYWSTKRDQKTVVLDYSSMNFVCARWNQPEFQEARERNRVISCIDMGVNFHPPLKRSIHSEYSAVYAYCMGLRHRYRRSSITFVFNMKFVVFLLFLLTAILTPPSLQVG